jgi:amidophosphoribosyltransferase
LIGATYQLEEIRKYVGADTLGYASIEGMLKSMPLPPKEFCVACFDGNYPVEFPRESSGKEYFGKRRRVSYGTPR